MQQIFFFSSRRRHTRCSRDWSSDVCSSDLFARCDWRRGRWILRRKSSAPAGGNLLWRPAARICATPRACCANLPVLSPLPSSPSPSRSEEHTSELQSRLHLVCRLLLEKKKT